MAFLHFCSLYCQEGLRFWKACKVLSFTQLCGHPECHAGWRMEYPHSMHLFQSMTQRMNGVVNQNMDQAWRRLMTQVLPLLPHKLHICQDIAVRVGWSGDIGPYGNDVFDA